MGRQIKVSLKVIPPRSGLFRKAADNIHLEEGSTIFDLLDLLHDSFLNDQRRYDEEAGWVSIFWGHLLFKNGELVGSFDKENFEAFKGANTELREGDRIVIMPPLAGG